MLGKEITLAIRGGCNYSCFYCVGNREREKTNHFDVSMLHLIYNNYHGFVVTNFECGASEPILHPQIKDVLGIALSYGCATIPTNNSIHPDKWLPADNTHKLLVRNKYRYVF